MGKLESEPVFYTWNPLYNLLGLIVWLIFAACYILPKENRRLRTLWILVPVSTIYLLLMGTIKITNMPSEAIQVFTGVFESLVLGFAAVWLLAERIGGRNRFVTWLLALAVFAVFVAVSLINLNLGIEMVAMTIFFGISVGILLTALPLGAFMCRQRFGPVRFCLWTDLWIMIFTLVITVPFACIQILMSGMSVSEYLPQAILAALIFAGIQIVGLLPFEILLFASSFWRRRFEKVFGIATRPTAVSTEQVQPPAQN